MSDTCTTCGTELKCLAGHSAHALNWYCPRCELKAERDGLRADIASMVKKAADNHLAGYRELGSRAAATENALDAISAERDEYARAMLWAHILAAEIKRGKDDG